MKRFRAAAIAAVLIVLLLFSSCSLPFDGALSLVTFEEFDAQDIKTFSIATEGDNVVVFYSEGDKISVSEYSSLSGERYKVKISKSPSQLQVEEGNRPLWAFTRRLEIGLPASFKGSLNINTTSGSIKISDVSGEELFLNSTSGAVNADSLSCSKLTAGTTSGSATLKGINCSGSLALSSKSGKIEASNVSAADISAQNNSGKIDVSSVSASSISAENTSGGISFSAVAVSTADFSSTSGGIHGNLSGANPETLTAESKSGSIRLSIPSGARFEASAQCTSGSISSDFPFESSASNRLSISAGENPDFKVDLKTTSGSVKLIKN